MFRLLAHILVCTLLCSCVWNDTENSPDFLPLDDSEYPYADLPRLVIETENFSQIRDKETKVPAKLQIYGKDRPESDVLDLTIKGRGNSSFVMAKYGFKLKFAQKQALFGMPADKEWDLVANQRDKSMLRNFITYKLAEILEDSYAPRSQFVEIYLNREYLGVYQLAEHQKVSESRVNIAKNDSSYFFEKTSQTAKDGNLIKTKIGYIYEIRYPKNPTEESLNILKDHLDSFENFIQSKSTYNIDSIYRWIDLDDLIRYYWIQEFSKNQDGAFRRSQFVTWEKGYPMQMGPVWDFDLAYGLSSDTVVQPDSWYVKKYGWYRFLFKNKQVQEKVKAYWTENRAKFKSILEFIDQTYPQLSKAMVNEFKRWPVLGEDSFWPFIESFDSYEDAVNALKAWIERRLEWIDWNIAP